MNNPPLALSLPVSAASTLAFIAPDSVASGRSSLTPPAGLCLPRDLADDSMQMSATSERPSWSVLTSLQPDSRVRMHRPWDHVKQEAGEVSPGSARGSSGKSSASLPRYAPNGWCLRTSWACSTSTMARIFRRSSKPLPRAGIMSPGGCWILDISESPRRAVESSFSAVLDSPPHWSSWLTPGQWKAYLSRLARSNSHAARWPMLPILLQRAMPHAESILAARLSSLSRTDGVRWLSGAERLKLMGFPSDWMDPISSLHTEPGTPLSPLVRSGLPKK